MAPDLLRIVIHEGRNRQVRRMLDAVGHPVRRLVRTRIGPVTDTTLRPGKWRMLRSDEVNALYAESVKAPRKGVARGAVRAAARRAAGPAEPSGGERGAR